MISRAMPFYECRKGIYEIDEFDCADIFVIEGDDRALVLDTGTGIGDLKGLIESRITKKPYEVAATHNHGDHVGGAGWFDEIYIHPADMCLSGYEGAPTVEFRKSFAELIRTRENKHYAYDPERDIRPWPAEPKLLPLEDGHVFDLGGRRVTAWHCPGHTAGEMVFIDDLTRTLLCGDAFNCFWLLNDGLAEDKRKNAQIALDAMKRVYNMRDQYDSVYNFHHDYRGFGSPLSADVIPNVITCLSRVLDGSANYVEVPNPLSGLTESSPENSKSTITVAAYGNVIIKYVSGDITQIR